MSNSIKYNVSSEARALKKGNFWVGTNDVPKGPTSLTGFYSGIVPPGGGYTIYINKASNGPAVYCPPNDTDLISLTNRIAQANYTTVAECLSYFGTQSDKMIVNRDYEPIITDGLIAAIDAGFSASYPRTGVPFYSIGNTDFSGTANNSPIWTSTGGGSLQFDGTDDILYLTNNTSSLVSTTNEMTIQFAYMVPTQFQGTSQIQLFDMNITPNLYRNAHWGWNIFGCYTWYYNTSNSYVGEFTSYLPRAWEGSWTVVQMAFSANGTWNFYQNGSFVSTGTQPNFQRWRFSSLGAAGNTARIQGNQTLSYYFSHMYVYDRALSGAEMIQNYDAIKARFI